MKMRLPSCSSSQRKAGCPCNRSPELHLLMMPSMLSCLPCALQIASRVRYFALQLLQPVKEEAAVQLPRPVTETSTPSGAVPLALAQSPRC